MKNCKKLITLFSLLSIVACSYRPILDPHGKYLEVGQAQAEEDIDACKEEAEAYLDQYKAERAAREAGRKSIVGGVIGTGVGFLSGGNSKSTLLGTAIGAGAGAMLAGLSVLGEDKVTPDQMKQRYMTTCLGQKGYSVIGWK